MLLAPLLAAVSFAIKLVDGLAAIGTMNPLCIVSFFTSTL
jgi:hypothetical protein